MARFICVTQVVDNDGLHQPGDAIELTPQQGSKALLEAGAIKRAPPKPKKATADTKADAEAAEPAASAERSETPEE